MDPSRKMDAVKLTPLRRISHPKGDILHGLKASDADFDGFGEAYFSSIHHGEIKGWKKHVSMNMNLIVPVGLVRFHIHQPDLGTSVGYDIGISNYCRLNIPPGYWFAFEGLSTGTSLVLNLANIEHDPEEVFSAALESYPMANR